MNKKEVEAKLKKTKSKETTQKPKRIERSVHVPNFYF